jgi:hypothetical protein
MNEMKQIRKNCYYKILNGKDVVGDMGVDFKEILKYTLRNYGAIVIL